VSVTLFMVSRAAFGSNFYLDNDQNDFWVRLPMIFPLFRMFTLIGTTRAAVYTVFKVIPRFSGLFVLMLLVFYVYAVFGNARISNQIEYVTVDVSSYVFFGFASMAQSWLTLFQMLVSEGWDDIMNDTIIATNNFAWAFYFGSFMFIVTLIFTNLFFGLVLAVIDEIEKDRRIMAEVDQEPVIVQDDDDDDDDNNAQDGFDSPTTNYKGKSKRSIKSNEARLDEGLNVPLSPFYRRQISNRDGNTLHPLQMNASSTRLSKRSGSTAATMKKYHMKKRSLQYVSQRGGWG